MVGNCCVANRRRVKPDFVTAGSLVVKSEAAHFQLPDDFTIAKPREPAHSRSHYNGVFTPVADAAWQWRGIVAVALCLDQFSGNIARNIERFRDGPPLSYQSRELIGRAQK